MQIYQELLTAAVFAEVQPKISLKCTVGLHPSAIKSANPSILRDFGRGQGTTQESKSLCTMILVCKRDMLGVTFFGENTTLFDREHKLLSLENPEVRCESGDFLVYTLNPWLMEEEEDTVDMEVDVIVRCYYRIRMLALSMKFLSDATYCQAHNHWQSRLINTFLVSKVQLPCNSESILEFARINKVERN